MGPRCQAGSNSPSGIVTSGRPVAGSTGTRARALAHPGRDARWHRTLPPADEPGRAQRPNERVATVLHRPKAAARPRRPVSRPPRLTGRGPRNDGCLACDGLHRASPRPPATRRPPSTGGCESSSTAVRRPAAFSRTAPSTHRPHRTGGRQRAPLSWRGGTITGCGDPVSVESHPTSDEGRNGAARRARPSAAAAQCPSGVARPRTRAGWVCGGRGVRWSGGRGGRPRRRRPRGRGRPAWRRCATSVS